MIEGNEISPHPNGIADTFAGFVQGVADKIDRDIMRYVDDQRPEETMTKQDERPAAAAEHLFWERERLAKEDWRSISLYRVEAYLAHADAGKGMPSENVRYLAERASSEECVGIMAGLMREMAYLARIKNISLTAVASLAIQVATDEREQRDLEKQAQSEP
jgi:hypothetical protein